MRMSMRFEGGKELAAALMSLPERTSRTVQRSILKEAAEPIRARMAQLAERGDEAPHIADNIVVSNARAQESDEIAVAIGPARGFIYGFFLEWGTVKMSAKPFMRPAWDGEASATLQRIKAKLWDALTKKGALSRPETTRSTTGSML